MKRRKSRLPKPGTVLAKVERRGRISVVITRIVTAIEKRYPRGTTIVYHRHRRRPRNLCRCTLSQWRRWARTAKRPIQ